MNPHITYTNRLHAKYESCLWIRDIKHVFYIQLKHVINLSLSLSYSLVGTRYDRMHTIMSLEPKRTTQQDTSTSFLMFREQYEFQLSYTSHQRCLRMKQSDLLDNLRLICWHLTRLADSPARQANRIDEQLMTNTYTQIYGRFAVFKCGWRASGSHEHDDILINWIKCCWRLAKWTSQQQQQ